MELNKTELMQIRIYLNHFYDLEKKDCSCSKEDLKTIENLLKKLKKVLTNNQ